MERINAACSANASRVLFGFALDSARACALSLGLAASDEAALLSAWLSAASFRPPRGQFRDMTSIKLSDSGDKKAADLSAGGKRFLTLGIGGARCNAISQALNAVIASPLNLFARKLAKPGITHIAFASDFRPRSLQGRKAFDCVLVKVLFHMNDSSNILLITQGIFS